MQANNQTSDNVEGVVSKQPAKQQTNLSDKGKAKAELRQERLAAALRQNLKRRKTQQGGRQTLSKIDELAVPDGPEELD